MENQQMLVKSIKILSAIVLLFITLMVISYVAIGWNDIPFDAAAKSNAPGRMVSISDGEIHYQWIEPAEENTNGETVVMSHGYGVPGFMFQQIAQMLADDGYKVLIFDHFGHGFSDRPNKPFNSDFFNREVTELLQALEITEPVILIGQSMGAMIASNYTVTHSKLVKKLVLFVPAGLRMVESENKGLVNMLATPVIGSWIWRVFGRAAMEEPDPPPCELCGNGKIVGDVYVQAQYEGYFESMHNILVEYPMNKQDHVYHDLAKVKVPTLAFFGEQDRLVKPESADLFQLILPDSSVIVLPHGDHVLHIRHWNEVGNKVIQWLHQ